MKRIRQTHSDIEASLSPLESSWRDSHADRVIQLLEGLTPKAEFLPEDIIEILDRDFDAGLTVVRLFLDLSKDEFTHALGHSLGSGGVGVKRYQRDRLAYVQALCSLKLCTAMGEMVHRPLRWSDVLVERLKAGRGSAIKGQARGRGLENEVEDIVRSVFSGERYVVRRRFHGAKGTSTEKADFAIPSAEDPSILIEVKAYGATGSKQTDVLGDVARILEEKRPDTLLLLVTDGITWRQRPSDLRKLVTLQNEGKIFRIYTKKMEVQLRSDLEELKRESHL